MAMCRIRLIYTGHQVMRPLEYSQNIQLSQNLNPSIIAGFEYGCQPHRNITLEGYQKITCNNITYLDDIKAHVNYMLATSTIVTCP
jgi:hypothetical protein